MGKIVNKYVGIYIYIVFFYKRWTLIHPWEHRYRLYNIYSERERVRERTYNYFKIMDGIKKTK